MINRSSVVSAQAGSGGGHERDGRLYLGCGTGCNLNSNKLENMKTVLTLIATAFLALGVHAAGFPDITIDQLSKAIAQKKVAVIDVNGSASFKQGRIPGAIDFEQQKSQLAKLLPKDKDTLVVAYCGGPKCGAYQAAAKAAKELGYTNVKHLSAGISGWKAAGQKVETSS
jgi:rhodanese-related sulfurtransferase